MCRFLSPLLPVLIMRAGYIEIQQSLRNHHGKAWRRSGILRGWRVGVFAGAGTAILVLALNIVLLAWDDGHALEDDGQWVVIRFKGSCSQMSAIQLATFWSKHYEYPSPQRKPLLHAIPEYSHSGKGRRNSC